MPPRTVSVMVGGGGDYVSLNAALSGESADLVTNTRLLTINCYAGNDTTLADTGSGYTTNSSYYIYITCPAGERHVGVWDESKYRMTLTRTTNGGGLIVQESYTKIEFIQIWLKCNASLTYIQAIRQATGGLNPCYMDSVILRYSVTSGSCQYVGGIYWYEADLYARNMIIYDMSGTTNGYGISIDGVSGVDGYLYNITVVDCSHNGIMSTVVNGAVTKNCLAHNCATGFTNCNETTDSTGNPTFVNESGDNFDIDSADTVCKDHGTDLTAESWRSLVDIANRNRGTTWDIGAFEYVAAGGPVYIPCSKYVLF